MHERTRGVPQPSPEDKKAMEALLAGVQEDVNIPLDPRFTEEVQILLKESETSPQAINNKILELSKLQEREEFKDSEDLKNALVLLRAKKFSVN